ncbi:MAG: ABC transporter ATP-binding protein [Candidatus Thermoplasmatota archaeon]|nr:ABC transporter ATP-binding protein [Candidatus Thermoplasmatota archaeon]
MVNMESIIETQNLTKKYNSFFAVKNLNLKIRKGEVFGFLGPNGAGKTTSIKMITGILKPTKGEVLIDGKRVSSMIREKIGLCPQEIVIWDSLTCEENLRLIGEMYNVEKNVLKERTEKLLKDLMLTDKTRSLASSLSGGMKRRLNLGMALVHEPDIVVLDEPSAGLDPQSRLVLWDYINSLSKNRGKTIILTTHFMEEADRLSDRVAIMDKGELLVLDTPESLKKKLGKGDVIEIKLSESDMNKKVLEMINTIDGVEEAKEIRGRIVVRALDAVNKIPKIIDRIEGLNTTIADVSIRRNTLEDVFISLTGRGLRE